MGRRPTQGDENVCPATAVAGSAVLPFVISTRAPKERSGEICRSTVPPRGMFCSAANLAGITASPFVISAGAQRRERSAVSPAHSRKC
jgi:hypothetical protein